MLVSSLTTVSENNGNASHLSRRWQPSKIMVFIMIVSALLVLVAGLTFRRLRRRCTGRFESMSPDSVSSLFPDRPIRPLPKRRLRERLSPDVADSIQYPPAPQTTTPLFSYPYNLKEEDAEATGATGRERRLDLEGSYAPRRHRLGTESDEDDALLRRAVVTRPPPEALGRSARLPSKPEPPRHSNPHPPSSTTSSADGYDSFENTNNKKKRKIPTAGDISINSGHGLNETGSVPGSLGASLPSVEGHGDIAGSTTAPYYGSGSLVSGGQGISGPGRGRYGRVRNGRSPLRALSDASNNWAGRNAKLRPPQWASQTSKFPHLPLLSFPFPRFSSFRCTVKVLCADTFMSFKTRAPESYLMLLPTQRNSPHYKVKKTSVFSNNSSSSSSSSNSLVNPVPRQVSLLSPATLRCLGLSLGQGLTLEILTYHQVTKPPAKGNTPNQRKLATQHLQFLETLKVQGCHKMELPKVARHDKEEPSRRSRDAAPPRSIRLRRGNAARIRQGRTRSTRRNLKINGSASSANTRGSLAIHQSL